MKKILIDTSVVIDFLRRKDREKTLLYTLVQDNYQLYVSIITHTELYAGKSVWEKKEAREDLHALFAGITILPFQEEISKKAGEIKAHYNIDLLDAIIVASAFTHKLHVATLNVKDFKKIKGLKLFV